MKFVFVALMLLVVVVVNEVEGQGICIHYEEVCTQDKTGCCSGLSCTCYKVEIKGVQAPNKCWCLESDVVYSNEEE
nr:venom protein [Lampona murina]